MLGTENDNFTQPGFQAVQASGLPIERLSREDCGLRFPQFDTRPYDTFAYNHEGGILHASTCLLALRDLVLDLGGAIYESCRVTHIISDSQQRPVRLRLSYGNEISADRVVLATGSWVHRLLADLRLPVRLTRQYLLYFAGLPFSLFSPGTFPVFIAQDLYGFPIYQGCNGWLKAPSHKFGLPVHPDEVSLPHQGIIAQITAHLREPLPPLHPPPLAHPDPCPSYVPPDKTFIFSPL